MQFIGGVRHPSVFGSWHHLLHSTVPVNLSQARPPSHLPPADAVFVSGAEWDAIDVPSGVLLPGHRQFLESIFAAYPADIPIVVRLANPTCCENRFPGKLCTQQRRQYINEAISKLWTDGADGEGLGRPVFVFNPTMAARNRRDIAERYRCWSNHALFSHVAIENQHWLNMVCNHWNG